MSAIRDDVPAPSTALIGCLRWSGVAAGLLGLACLVGAVMVGWR